MARTLDGVQADETFDVVVIGAGAAGMTAALVSAIRGAKVLLVERTEYVGGTTAWSAGTIWVPGTRHGPAGGDPFAAAYLDQIVGNHASRAMRAAFLEAGPGAIAEIEAHSEVQLRACLRHPDYRSELPGASLSGRALEPLPFDGRKLGDRFALLRPPIPEFTVLGGMMVDRTDIGHLLSLRRSWSSFRHAATLVARYAWDRMRWPRGTRLVMGNALAGRLLHSLIERNVVIATGTELAKIVMSPDGSVTGAIFRSGSTNLSVRVTGGLILATGGFSLHPLRRPELIDNGEKIPFVGAPGNTGAAQDLALAVGARIGNRGASNAFWTPVSVRSRPNGSRAVFPHFVLDRSKPGTMIVDQNGLRFANEAISYHEFGLRMQQPGADGRPIRAFLVTDADGLRRYGLGMVRPGGWGLKQFLDDGYLVSARTLRRLADALDIDPVGLERTAAEMCRFAQTGNDEAFGRGATEYQRHNGDATQRLPNSTLGPIARPPFYAIRLQAGDIGAATGLITDGAARVLGPNDAPIPGLYACGNDMHSVMGGTYPGPGITLGPALTFGTIAARHAVGRSGAIA
jgi:succinate dehydrogenase/fumarate reductase flavoprotein subunit